MHPTSKFATGIATILLGLHATGCASDDSSTQGGPDAGDAASGGAGATGTGGRTATGGKGGGGASTGGRSSGGGVNAGGTNTGGTGTGGTSTGGAGTGGASTGGVSPVDGGSGGAATGGTSPVDGGAGGSAGSDGGSIEGGAGDASALVTGTMAMFFHGVTSAVTLADNPTGIVGALVPNGSGFDVVNAVGSDDGSFTLAVPPATTYWLTVGAGSPEPVYLETSARVLDLGRDQLGRPNIAPPTSPTEVTFNATGLAAWDSSVDGIYLYSVEAASVGGFLGAFAPVTSGAPLDTDTALVNTKVDWGNTGMALIDGTAGDTLWVMQQRVQTAGTEFYRAFVRGFSTTSLVQTDGVASAVSGTFASPPAVSASFDFRTTEFAALMADINPNATFDPTPTRAGGLAVTAQPKLATIGARGPSADLFLYDVDSPDDATADVNLGTIAVPNPFPSPWDLVASGFWFNRVLYRHPAATTGTRIRVVNSVADAQATLLSGPIRPALSPVRAIKVDGQDGYADRSGVGLTPTLSWTAPAIGTPTLYAVQAWLLTVNGTGGTSRAFAGVVLTANTSVKLPPGFFQAGASYVIQIDAMREGNLDLTAHPFRSKVPSVIAGALTGILSP